MVEGEDDVDGFFAFSPVVEAPSLKSVTAASPELVDAEVLPVLFVINPLEKDTLTTPASYLSHREMRGAMGPCTAHKTWVLPTWREADPSEREREESSAERGRRVVGVRCVFGRG